MHSGHPDSGARPPARYRSLLRAPRVAPIVTAAAIGRIPLGMSSLGTILVLRAGGRSYAAAGLAVGLLALGTAASQPPLGRLIDRVGVRRVFVPLSLGYGASGTALALLGASRQAPLAAIVIVAFASGALLPPVGSAMRGAWPSLLPEGVLLGSAFAIEAVIQELGFLIGPPLVTLLTVAFSARTALLCAAAVGALGGLAFALLAGGLAGPPRVRGARALASRATRRLVVISLTLGISFGAVEVAFPAFAERHGARPVAGVIAAALSLGSVLGGVVLAAGAAPRSQARRLTLALGAFGVTLAPLLIVDSMATMIVLACVAGAPIAPAFAAQYVLLDRGSVRGAATETFAWNSTAIFVGASIGTAAGGLAISHSGYRASLLFGMLAVFCGALATCRWAPSLSGRD